jgi:hypothetical protein
MREGNVLHFPNSSVTPQFLFELHEVFILLYDHCQQTYCHCDRGLNSKSLSGFYNALNT